MKKNLAEAIGTFALVFFGCGTIVFMASEVGLMGVSFAFGLTVVAVAYGLGSISGAHLNPAVSLGVLLSGKMSVSEFVGYVVSQCIGGVVAALVLSNMGGDITSAVTMPGAFGIGAALTFEIVATFLFVTIILGATQDSSNYMAGIAIGLALVAIHLAGIKVSGASVNPARTLATNIFDTNALQISWLYFVGPLIGGALAGWVHNLGFTKSQN